MRALVWCVLFASLAAEADAGQRPRQPRSTAPAEPNSASTATADAYNQFLLARRLERDSDIDGAIAASEKEPQHSILLRVRSPRRSRRSIWGREPRSGCDQHRRTGAEDLAIEFRSASCARCGVCRTVGCRHEKRAGYSIVACRRKREESHQPPRAGLKDPDGEPDPNLLANLARMYVRTQEYRQGDSDAAIAGQSGTWLAGGPQPVGRGVHQHGKNTDAITWLESAVEDDPRLYATLGDFYDRERRWKDAAGAYTQAARRAPQHRPQAALRLSPVVDGERANSQKARDLLAEVVSSRPTDQRALYLLSQAHRRASDPANAEAAARRLIGLNKQSPWGYYALAEALQDRQRYRPLSTPFFQ